jgi:hypothetical protein
LELAPRYDWILALERVWIEGTVAIERVRFAPYEYIKRSGWVWSFANFIFGLTE